MELLNNDCMEELYSYPPTYPPLEGNEVVGDAQLECFPELDEVYSTQTQGQTFKSKKKKLANWTTDEDLFLVSAWLNTSLNGATAADQKRLQYWTRVLKLYNEIRTLKQPELPVRSSVQSRWNMINKSVGAFKAHYGQVTARPESGYNDQDKLTQAKALYMKLENHTFEFEKYWEVLKNEPKWMNLENLQAKKGKSKTSKGIKNALESSSGATDVIDVDLNDSSSPGNFDDAIRPVGKKRAKADQKNVQNQLQEAIRFTNHLRKMEEAKEKDREAKLIAQGEKREEKQLAREERKKEHEQKMAVQEESLMLEKRKQDMLEEQHIMQKERERKQEEKQIVMTMDLSVLDKDSRTYFQSRRREIIASQLARSETLILDGNIYFELNDFVDGNVYSS